MVVASLDWTQIILAGITAAVAMVNGLGIALLYSHLRTPSRTSIGKQVEDALQTSIATNFRVQALANAFDAPMPARAAAVEAKVEALNEIKTRAERAAGG